MVQSELNEEIVEHYGELKQTYENEGDGYFFYGYGLPSEYQNDKELVKLYDEASTKIEEFKKHVEKKITDHGGDPEEWVM